MKDPADYVRFPTEMLLFTVYHDYRRAAAHMQQKIHYKRQRMSPC